LIAIVVNKSDYSKHVEADHVITIWIDENETVWIKMLHGYARFHKEQFKLVLAEVKTSLAPKQPTRRQQNQALADELRATCRDYGVSHSQIDWLSFSTSIFIGKRKTGEIGFGVMGYWFRGVHQKNNVRVEDMESAIALLVARSVPVKVA